MNEGKKMNSVHSHAFCLTFYFLCHLARKDPSTSCANNFFWTSNSTKILIDLFKKYRDKVGSMNMKNFKAMWDVISKEISNMLKMEISAKNAENRWKVLERNYKKYVDNQNSTGRGRKYFEFHMEMEDIYGKKRNIRPEILLGSETVHVPTEEIVTDEISAETTINQETEKSKVINDKDLRKKNTKRKRTILQQIREDKVEYQEKRFNFLEKVHEDLLSILRERNKIEEERNEILKNKKCRCDY